MKKLILVGCFLFSSIVYAEGKPPEWWCRVSPDGSSESKSFLQYGLTPNEACSLAMAQCTTEYETCEIDGYGEW